MNALARHAEDFKDRLDRLHAAVRQAVVDSRTRLHDPARVVRHAAGDVLYRIDTHVEPIVLEQARQWAADCPLVLIAEGIGEDGVTVLPDGASETDAIIRLIVDPIDGTRGLMYDKRSAWCLTGIAPNRGSATCLADIEIAMMSELPTAKQNRCDILYAVRGQGVEAKRHTIGETSEPIALAPSTATNLDHGFAAVSSFFPTTKRLAADLMEAIASRLSQQEETSTPLIFDDQYISTGGQLYELIAGHDRFLCDLRPLFYALSDQPVRHCCHPYDICTMLIAQESGVLITDGQGRSLNAPLDVHTNLNWAGYANADLKAAIEPVTLDWIARQGKELSG